MQRLATETAEERERRLEVLRSNQTQRLALETVEERERRLQQLHDNRAERLASETIEERESRLQQLRDNKAERLASETSEERDTRLQVQRDTRKQRIISETESERAIRLEHLRVIANSSRRPALEDDEGAERRHEESDRQRRHRELERLRPQRIALTQAYAKMAKFHSDLAALELSKCSICLERSHAKKCLFQNSEQSVCTRCKRDKSSPKLYSSENNMDPVQHHKNCLD